MKRRLFSRLLFSLLTTLSILATTSSADEPETVTVTLYHTSDLHEHSQPMPRIAGFVEAQKQENPNTLFVDTGDWFNKGDLTDLQTRGEAMADLLGACNYDAMIPGNHDYSFGTKRLAELIDRFSLPVVAANCRWPDDIKPRDVPAYRIFKFDQVTVAVIGTATPIDTQRIDTLLEILPMEKTLRGVVAELKQRADILVLLTHVGTPADKKLARALPDLDVIFGGHDHQRYKKLVFLPETKTVIQHSGALGQSIGALTLTWNGQEIVARKLRVINVTDELPESIAVEKRREKYVLQPVAQ